GCALPAAPPLEETFRTAYYIAVGDPARLLSPQSFPASWPEPKAQTLLLADKSPLRANFDHDRVVPTSPLMHIQLIVGDSVIIRKGPMRDFTGEERAYADAHRV